MTIAEWTTYVKTYAADNNLTYKQALSQALPSYKARNQQPVIPDEKPIIKKGVKKEIKNNIVVVEEAPKPKKQTKKNNIIVDLSESTINTQNLPKISNIKKIV
jgi:hypothetical protein